MKEKIRFMKGLWFFAAILLCVTGVIALLNPQNTVVTLAILFGIIMLMTGLISIGIFIKYHEEVYGAGWILVDGLLTTIMGVVILCNQYLKAGLIPFLFSAWIMLCGITRVVWSFDLRRFEVTDWSFVLIFGMLEILFGVLTFFEPITAAFAIGTLIGIIFIFYGVSMLVNGITVNSYVKNIKKELGLKK